MSPLAKLWMMDLLETAYIIDPDYTEEDFMEECLSEKMIEELNRQALAPTNNDIRNYLVSLQKGETY